MRFLSEIETVSSHTIHAMQLVTNIVGTECSEWAHQVQIYEQLIANSNNPSVNIDSAMTAAQLGLPMYETWPQADILH